MRPQALGLGIGPGSVPGRRRRNGLGYFVGAGRLGAGVVPGFTPGLGGASTGAGPARSKSSRAFMLPL